MSRAAKPGAIKTLQNLVEEMEGGASNVGLDLNTGAFFVKDAKGNLVKTFKPQKGSDAVYIVNNTERSEDLTAASKFMQDQRAKLATNASTYETQFAATQETLLKTVEMWRGATPGTSRDALSLQIGRIQIELAKIEHALRSEQYKNRKVLEVTGLRRRTYVPSSNDDRVVPHPVFRLDATQTSVLKRILPININEA
jgi:hypothetical protein